MMNCCDPNKCEKCNAWHYNYHINLCPKCQRELYGMGKIEKQKV